MNRRRRRRGGRGRKKKKSKVPPEERVKQLEEQLFKDTRASRHNERVWTQRNERLTEMMNKISKANDDLKHEMERINKENQDILNRERKDAKFIESKLKRMTDYNRRLFEEKENLKSEIQQKDDECQKKIDEEKVFYEQKLEQKKKDIEELQRSVMRHLESRHFGEQKLVTEKDMKDREVIYQQKLANLQKQFDRVLQIQRNDYEERLTGEVQHRMGVEHEATVSTNKVLKRDVSVYEDMLLEKRIENERLKREIRKLESDVLILSSQCDDLIKRNGILQHKIYTLEEAKGLRKNVKIFKELEEVKKDIEEKKNQIEEKEKKIQKMSNEMEILQNNLKENIRTFNILKTEYNKKFEMNSEISKFIYDVMKDVKLKLGPWKRIHNLYGGRGSLSNEDRRKHTRIDPKNDVIPASLDRLDEDEREKVLRYLLKQLNLYTVKRRKTKYIYTMEDNKERFSLPPILTSPNAKYFKKTSVSPEKNMFSVYRDYRKRRSVYN